VPGGVCTPGQWLALDQIASDYANGTLRLTTRQAFQFHGVINSNLKTSMQAINATLLDTIAACGDVNRNVMCNPNPHQSVAHAQALELARAISDHLTPRTRAYHEIWLDGEKVVSSEVEEPIYGPHYLPRKFKTVVAVPPSNDVDVFAQDLGFIAITDQAGKVAGYNVTVGGGMGMTHGEPETYPRTADVMGFCTPEQWLAMDRIATDYGNGTLRLTTRQAFQFHGVIKSNLKRTMQAINASLLDTIAACGDVNRNVMCNPNPHQSRAHAATVSRSAALIACMLRFRLLLITPWNWNAWRVVRRSVPLA
jgi:sulfite reductase (NADPH) hemoprotein beta-component